MGYYKNLHTPWGTCGEHEEERRLDRLDAMFDDSRYEKRTKLKPTSVQRNPSTHVSYLVRETGQVFGPIPIEPREERWAFEQKHGLGKGGITMHFHRLDCRPVWLKEAMESGTNVV